VKTSNGLVMEITNSRGVTTRAASAGGDQERELGEKYARYAAGIEDRWPRTLRSFAGWPLALSEKRVGTTTGLHGGRTFTSDSAIPNGPGRLGAPAHVPVSSGIGATSRVTGGGKSQARTSGIAGAS